MSPLVVALVVVLLGAAAYVIPGNAERRELGRLAYAVGLLAFLLRLALPLW